MSADACARRDCACTESATDRLDRLLDALRSRLRGEDLHLFEACIDADSDAWEGIMRGKLEYLVERLAGRIPEAADAIRATGRLLFDTDPRLAPGGLPIPGVTPPAA
jgi:hypothetical protein